MKAKACELFIKWIYPTPWDERFDLQLTVYCPGAALLLWPPPLPRHMFLGIGGEGAKLLEKVLLLSPLQHLLHSIIFCLQKIVTFILLYLLQSLDILLRLHRRNYISKHSMIFFFKAGIKLHCNSDNSCFP